MCLISPGNLPSCRYFRRTRCEVPRWEVPLRAAAKVIRCSVVTECYLAITVGNMVYDWEGKEAECYRLYVEQRKPLDAVMAHFAALGFAPRCVCSVAGCRTKYEVVIRAAHCSTCAVTANIFWHTVNAPFKRSSR